MYRSCLCSVRQLWGLCNTPESRSDPSQMQRRRYLGLPFAKQLDVFTTICPAPSGVNHQTWRSLRQRWGKVSGAQVVCRALMIFGFNSVFFSSPLITLTVCEGFCKGLTSHKISIYNWMEMLLHFYLIPVVFSINMHVCLYSEGMMKKMNQSHPKAWCEGLKADRWGLLLKGKSVTEKANMLTGRRSNWPPLTAYSSNRFLLLRFCHNSMLKLFH